MGLFAEWVMMKGVTVSPAAVEARLSVEGLKVARAENGWLVAPARGHELDALVARLNTLTVEPVIAGWVYDSDFAYLMGVGAGSCRFALVIGAPYVDSDDEDVDPTLVQLASDEGRRRSADACAVWSQANARAVSGAAVLKILERDWTFAEEGIVALTEAMGLPSPLPTDEPQRAREQASVEISLSTHMLATLSATRLVRRLDRFGRSQGMSSDGDTIEIHLHDAEGTEADFDELLAEVQRFVDEIGLPQATVFAAGRAHTVHRQARTTLDDA